MSEPARNRFALDLEDLERQLRGAAQPQRPANAVDPLVELTRIVGQDDPLKDLFAQRGRGPVAVRHEPSFVAPAPQPQAAPPAELRGALDEFEALLRRTEPARAAPAAEPAPLPAQPAAPAAQPMPDFDHLVAEAYARPAAPQAEQPRDLDQDAGYAADDRYAGYGDAQEPAASYRNEAPVADNDMPELEPQRSRKGLWTAAALLAVGVVGVGAAMVLRSGPEAANGGQPPVIAADASPTKVAPVNPGGAEIPNQNKQIYERAGESSARQAKVVTREEQPVDVQQAARTMPPRVVLAGPGTGAATEAGAANPLAQAPAAPERGVTPSEPLLTAMPPVPGLGEPRRVRTVSIRPDGTPAPAPSANAAYSNGPAPSAAAPVVNGAARPPVASPMTTATTTPPKPRPAEPARTPEAARTPEPAKTQERAAAPAPAPATTPASPVRVAAAQPTPAPAATPTPASAAIRSGTGDFAVQLAAPGSESEARATFAALQRKFPEQLGGQAPIVRKTELAGGKTVYRLRVGPYSRDDATTMCNQLTASGGQCFIAKN